MGNNNITDTEKLHIRLDENNVICIDPNSIINQDNLVDHGTDWISKSSR